MNAHTRPATPTPATTRHAYIMQAHSHLTSRNFTAMPIAHNWEMPNRLTGLEQWGNGKASAPQRPDAIQCSHQQQSILQHLLRTPDWGIIFSFNFVTPFVRRQYQQQIASIMSVT